MAGVALALVAAHPVAAQIGDQQPRLVDLPNLGPVYVLEVVDADPRALLRVIQVPGYGNVYLVPVKPRDTRTARQACIDEEVAKFAGSPSRLELRTIDLKCSQR